MLIELKKSVAREVAMSFVGKWYKWGGDDPSGFDCSGFVTEIMKSVGLIGRGERLTAVGFYNRFVQYKTDISAFGCLVFWGRPLLNGISYYNDQGVLVSIDPNNPRITTDKKYLITHIEFAIDFCHTVGASGGGSNTLTEADAIQQNAFVKVRPIDSRTEIAVAIVDPFKQEV